MKKVKLLSLLPILSLPFTSICSCSNKPEQSNTYKVKFYCGDLLVDSTEVKHGNKIGDKSISGFTIHEWYSDNKLTTKYDTNTQVTSDLELYAKFDTNFSYTKTNAPESLDEKGYGVSTNKINNVYVSKAELYYTSFCKLKDRGIIFNKDFVGNIKNITIKIDALGFKDAWLYCGKTPLSFDNSYQLKAGSNSFDLSGTDSKYFVIQSQGSTIYVDDFSISFGSCAKDDIPILPSFNIDTGGKEILDKQNYVDCKVTTSDMDSILTDEVGGIRLRGNSSLALPKKAYRIKFDKKQTFFGLEKAKNWVLLAEYPDGSKIHNYAALNFAKLIKGDSSFCPTPYHVKLYLNGKYQGIYLFCEHIDEKSGRMNLAQKEIWKFDSLDQFNFMMERDNSDVLDPTSGKIEGKDYFSVTFPDETTEYFNLKYPTIDDFVEIDESGLEIRHDDKFYQYFNWIKEYITNLAILMFKYQTDFSLFNEIKNIVDVNSLAQYGVVDQMFEEYDHKHRSFKFYRDVKESNLIKFGPNWDYDATSFGLPTNIFIYLDPFKMGSKTFDSTFFKEVWSYSLFSDATNGKVLFKNIWNNLSINKINAFVLKQKEELNNISYILLDDTEIWYENQIHAIFDNIRYSYVYILKHMSNLYNYFYNSIICFLFK